MNVKILEGNWKQFSGKVKEKWGKLTDNDLMAGEGQVDQLVGAIQKEYGISKEQAEQEVEKLYTSTFDV